LASWPSATSSACGKENETDLKANHHPSPPDLDIMKLAALNLPSQLYHGTSSMSLWAIEQHGLRPDFAGRGIGPNGGQVTRAAVYLCVDLDHAWEYAKMACGGFNRNKTELGGIPIVLAMRIADLDQSCLVPDESYYYDNAMTNAGESWQETLANGTVGYAGVIRADKLQLLLPPGVNRADLYGDS
jgi:hypothetical protein